MKPIRRGLRPSEPRSSTICHARTGPSDFLTSLISDSSSAWNNVGRSLRNASKNSRPSSAMMTTRLGSQSGAARSEEHTSELQSIMRISYAVFCLKKKKHTNKYHTKYRYHNHTQSIHRLTDNIK